MTLPWHVRVGRAQDLGVYDDKDANLAESDAMVEWVKRAKEKGIANELLTGEKAKDSSPETVSQPKICKNCGAALSSEMELCWNCRPADSSLKPAPKKECKYGDPYCPCKDGDPCHYEGPNPMKPVKPAESPMSAEEFWNKSEWFTSNRIDAKQVPMIISFAEAYAKHCARPTPIEPAESEREKFEKWWISTSRLEQFEREEMAPEIYKSPFAQAAWEGWQAARATPQAQQELIPIQYEIDDDTSILRRAKGWHYAEGMGKVEDGKELWSVSRRSWVLNKDGEWEYEPLPSSRTEDFLQRTRWNSAAEAHEFYKSSSQEGKS